MTEVTVINLTEQNMADFTPGPSCFMNIKHLGAQRRLAWIKEQLPNGLTIKILKTKEDIKPAGFIEYVPGEQAWRAVSAPNYLFIHCIWTYPKKNQKIGFGSRLVDECIKDTETKGKLGVAVTTSDGPFMANKSLFEKNGFTVVAESKPFQLLVKQLKDGPLPSFTNWEDKLATYKGWHIVYSRQCPWIARSIDELDEVIKKHKLDITITELKTAKEAQQAPSLYTSFNLIHDGKLLADHYISKRRFENIINKELNK